MHESEVVPARFVSVVEALKEALGSIDTRADRAELMFALMRSFELWTKANVVEEPRTQVGTMATEHETAETLAEATRSYWLKCLGVDGARERGAFGQRVG
ncbi:hypothetical protein [Plantibacter sp. RU18]|uniref:hypothetical protein n=1 Tax=Plantibacter sp. RU18 TaxID=3158143 RepID=UPI003D3620F3